MYASASDDGVLYLLGIDGAGFNQPADAINVSMSKWDGQEWSVMPSPALTALSGGQVVYVTMTSANGIVAVTSANPNQPQVWLASTNQWQTLTQYSTTDASQSPYLSIQDDGTLVDVLETSTYNYDAGIWSALGASLSPTRWINFQSANPVVRFASKGTGLFRTWADSQNNVNALYFDGQNWVGGIDSLSIGHAVTDLSGLVGLQGELIVAAQYSDNGSLASLGRFEGGDWTQLSTTYCPAYGCGLSADKKGRPILLNWGHPALRYNE